MANLISNQTGNFLTQSTWRREVLHYAQTTGTTLAAIPTTIAYNRNIAATGEIINRVLVLVGSVAGNRSGTVTCEIKDITGGAPMGSVTVSASDISFFGNGWHCFKFDPVIATISGNTYAIGLSSSVASQIFVYRSSQSANWWNAIVGASVGGVSPATDDNLFIVTDMSAITSNTSHVVTMNNNALTSIFGNISVCNGATLTFSTTANTQLGLSGHLNCYGGSTFNMGTSDVPIQYGTSALLQFYTATTVRYGINLFAGATGNFGGSVGNRTLFTQLSPNLLSGSTTSNYTDTTNWEVGDTFMIMGNRKDGTKSTRIYTVSSTAGTTVTHNPATITHQGYLIPPYDTRPHVTLISRNCVISATTGALFFYVQTSASVSACHTMIANCGTTTFDSISAGVSFSNANIFGKYNMSYCTFNEVTTILSSSNFSANLNFIGCSLFGRNFTNGSHVFFIGGSTISPTVILSGCRFSTTGTGIANIVQSSLIGGKFYVYDNVFSDCTVHLLNINTSASNVLNGDLHITGNYFYGASVGLKLAIGNFAVFNKESSPYCNVSKNIFYHCAGAGLSGTSICNVLFEGLSAFGNGSYHIAIGLLSAIQVLGEQNENLIFKNCWLQSGTGSGDSTTNGFVFGGVARNIFIKSLTCFTDSAAVAIPINFGGGSLSFSQATIVDSFIGVSTGTSGVVSIATQLHENSEVGVLNTRLGSTHYDQLQFRLNGNILKNTTSAYSGNECIQISLNNTHATNLENFYYDFYFPVSANTQRTISFFATKSSTYTPTSFTANVLFHGESITSSVFEVSSASWNSYTTVINSSLLPSTDGITYKLLLSPSTVGAFFLDEITYS